MTNQRRLLTLIVVVKDSEWADKNAIKVCYNEKGCSHIKEGCAYSGSTNDDYCFAYTACPYCVYNLMCEFKYSFSERRRRINGKIVHQDNQHKMMK